MGKLFNSRSYIHDRIKGKGQIPPLAEIIQQRAEQGDLGASWNKP